MYFTILMLVCLKVLMKLMTSCSCALLGSISHTFLLHYCIFSNTALFCIRISLGVCLFVCSLVWSCMLLLLYE